MSRIPVEVVPEWIARASEAGAIGPDTRAILLHDLGRMARRIEALRAAFPSDALHAIAIKANPLVALLAEIVSTGAGLEAASWEEVACARAAGCAPQDLVWDGPVKTDRELSQGLELGCWINADNPQELARLERLGARDRVGLRVNPGVQSGSIAATSTATKSAKFGVPLADAEDLVRRYPFIRGLHVHAGSQGCPLSLLVEATRATAEVVEALDLPVLDIGGGLPVQYDSDGPAPPAFAEWGAALRELPSWGRRRFITECGRSIQVGCGIALSRIEATKIVDGRPMLLVHLGADFALRRMYAPEAWNHELVVLDPQGRPRPGPVEPTAVAGPLCFSGDLWDRARPLPPAQPGDWLLIRDTGGYTLGMWSRHCSRGLPPTWGVQADGALRRLHPGESSDDVVRFWSG